MVSKSNPFTASKWNIVNILRNERSGNLKYAYINKTESKSCLFIDHIVVLIIFVYVFVVDIQGLNKKW